MRRVPADTTPFSSKSTQDPDQATPASLTFPRAHFPSRASDARQEEGKWQGRTERSEFKPSPPVQPLFDEPTDLSPGAQKALAAVEGYLRSVAPDQSSAGAGLFRSDSVATKAIKDFVSERCQKAFLQMARRTVEIALIDIDSRQSAGTCWSRKPLLNDIQKQLILLEQIKNNFLWASSGESPMNAAVPQDVRDFLRAVRNRVCEWAAPAGLSEASEANVVRSALILRGVSGWIAASHLVVGSSGDRKMLYPSLARLLMSLATRGDYRGSSGPSQANGDQLVGAVNALRPRFSANLDALVA